MSKAHVEVRQNEETKQWYWSAKARNGKSVGIGGEGYHNRADCVAGMKVCRTALRNALAK